MARLALLASQSDEAVSGPASLVLENLKQAQHFQSGKMDPNFVAITLGNEARHATASPDRVWWQGARRALSCTAAEEYHSLPPPEEGGELIDLELQCGPHGWGFTLHAHGGGGAVLVVKVGAMSPNYETLVPADELVSVHGLSMRHMQDMAIATLLERSTAGASIQATVLRGGQDVVHKRLRALLAKKADVNSLTPWGRVQSHLADLDLLILRAVDGDLAAEVEIGAHARQARLQLETASSRATREQWGVHVKQHATERRMGVMAHRSVVEPSKAAGEEGMRAAREDDKCHARASEEAGEWSAKESSSVREVGAAMADAEATSGAALAEEEEADDGDVGMSVDEEVMRVEKDQEQEEEEVEDEGQAAAIPGEEKRPGASSLAAVLRRELAAGSARIAGSHAITLAASAKSSDKAVCGTGVCGVGSSLAAQAAAAKVSRMWERALDAKVSLDNEGQLVALTGRQVAALQQAARSAPNQQVGFLAEGQTVVISLKTASELMVGIEAKHQAQVETVRPR